MGRRVSRAIVCQFARKAMLLCWAVVGWILACELSGRADAAVVLASAGVALTQDFDGIGSSTSVSGLNADGWRLSQGPGIDTFSGGTAALAFVQSGTLDASTTNFGNYNFGVGSDRAIGFMYGPGVTGPRSIMIKVTNSTGQTLNELALAWDLEEYRTGTRALPVTFFHGADGTNWTAEASGDQNFAADGPIGNPPPPNPPRKSVTLSGLSLAAGASYYLRWSFGQAGATSGAPGVGLDNFSISGSVVAVPEATAAALGLTVCGLAALGTLVRRMRRD